MDNFLISEEFKIFGFRLIKIIWKLLIICKINEMDNRCLTVHLAIFNISIVYI